MDIFLEGFIKTFEKDIESNRYSDKQAMLFNYRKTYYLISNDKQTSQKSKETLLLRLKKARNRYFIKNNSHYAQILSASAKDQEVSIKLYVTTFRQLIDNMITTDKTPTIDELELLEIVIAICEEIKQPSEAIVSYSNELRELFATANNYLSINKLMDDFEVAKKNNSEHYAYKSEFNKISSLIKSFQIPTPKMMAFLQTDIAQIEIRQKDKILTDVIYKEIKEFDIELQILSENKLYYIERFNKICTLIVQLHTPVEKFENFRHRNITKELEQKGLQKAINEKISVFNQNMQRFPGSYDYQMEFDDICELIRRVDNKTEDMLSFANMDTAKVSMRQDIVNQINKCIQLELVAFKSEYESIYNALQVYWLQSVFAKYLDTLYINKTRDWFEKHVTDRGKAYKIDEEQAAAIVDNHKNLLVKALAGSGKTRTLAAKIIYLVAICKVPESEIMAFVFNNNASEEINKRLKEIKVDGKQIITEPLASTFHSFAYANTKHSKILSDQDGKNRSLFIQDIISSIIPKENIYDFFRKEATKIGREQYESAKDFYNALRSRQFSTLDNQKVKSIGEKIICDFLFEHGINYMYEPNVYTSNLISITKSEELDFITQKDCIKPDFLLTDYKIVWEHWAITGNETLDVIREIDKKGVIGKYSDYKDNMEWKRIFYEREWVDPTKAIDNKYAQQVIDWKHFIETNYNENLSREDFEQNIAALLETCGIISQKLPKEELICKVWDRQIKRFTSLVVQFIDRTEQEYMHDISELEEKIKEIPENTRERRFLDIALKVYVAYKDKLAKDPIYDMDFNILMDKASTSISSDSDACNNIVNKNYILIDEFQDFSKLFLNFINAVKQLNPSLHLMCVGDEYQAINRFAGSNVEYFINFSTYFTEDPCVLNINTNYRCASGIVANAKDFMTREMGRNTNFTANKTETGTINLLDINQVFIENRQGHIKKDNIFKKEMVIQEDRNPDKRSIQYLKSVVWIINKHKDKKSIRILHRNNDMSFWNIDLDLFYKKLKETCVIMSIMKEEEFKQKVSISTMHSAKGLEAEVVILLEIDNSIIPSIHPDSSLFEVFGETEKVVVEDQQRLFYVALTRAEDDLYILYNGEKKSSFLNELQIAKELNSKDIRF